MPSVAGFCNVTHRFAALDGDTPTGLTIAIHAVDEGQWPNERQRCLRLAIVTAMGSGQNRSVDSN